MNNERPTTGARFIFPEQDKILEQEYAAEDQQTAEFLELNKSQFYHGRRQILRDPLARLLDTGSYVSNVAKPWGKDYRGRVIDVSFSREYPTKKVLVDDVGEDREEQFFAERRELCAQHGYIYLYSCPRMILNQKNMDEQMVLANEALKKVAAKMPDKALPAPPVADTPEPTPDKIPTPAPEPAVKKESSQQQSKNHQGGKKPRR